MDDRDVPVVEIQPATYQPSKAELEEDMSIDATPEDLLTRVMRTVDVRTISDE